MTQACTARKSLTLTANKRARPSNEDIHRTLGKSKYFFLLPRIWKKDKNESQEDEKGDQPECREMEKEGHNMDAEIMEFLLINFVEEDESNVTASATLKNNSCFNSISRPRSIADGNI